MARAQANPNVSVLVWARESAGLSLEAAAKKAGVSKERLEAWESEQEESQKPTFAQLRTLAVAYKRPLAVFYLPEPPKRFEAMHDFRRKAGAGGIQTPELTLEIRRAHDRREWAIELFEEIEEAPPVINESISIQQDSESAAEIVRKLLRVTLPDQRRWTTDYEAFREWRARIEEAGILTFQATGVDSEEARGFSIGERPLPVAVANIKDAPRGRIFTLLHEVAHILLRESGVCDLHESEEDAPSRIEAFCNRVAGAALFPGDALLNTSVVRAHPKAEMVWSDAELQQISRQFGGSREAALVRLLGLGLTTQAVYDQKSAEFKELYAQQKLKQKGGFVPPHELAITSAGPTFTSLVIESFGRERITASDVSDYLQVRLKHLPTIQRDFTKFST
ncbi:MAG TPA: XRE family transcriptional regulator [Terriglobales bacterium]|nr:XRE family transcriptional regulator [Terriglobales bacterium]